VVRRLLDCLCVRWTSRLPVQVRWASCLPKGVHGMLRLLQRWPLVWKAGGRGRPNHAKPKPSQRIQRRPPSPTLRLIPYALPSPWSSGWSISTGIGGNSG